MAGGALYIVLGYILAVLLLGDAEGASPKFCVDDSVLAYTYKEDVLTSPNYPHDVYQDMSCRLTISTGITDLCVRIDLTDLGSCEYGSVTFFNGWGASHGITRRMCDLLEETQPVIFKSSSITVQYRIASGGESRGFKLKYSAIFCEGHLVDISSPVTVTASSNYLSPSGMEFAPSLAIQPDTSHTWPSCFISKKEVNPWFTIAFESVISLFNMRLGVRISGGGQLPKDFTLSGMDKLSVYVSNSSTTETSGGQLCGNSWSYAHTKNIMLDCGKNLTGRYVHITLPSTAPTYLLICFMVLNKENGPPVPLTMSNTKATVESSGFDSNQPAMLAIDDHFSSCSLLTGVAKTWLRVDIQTILYIKQVRLLFNNESSGMGVKVYVGKSLRDNGLQGNTRYHPVSNATSGFQRMSFICEPPALGQFIYIEKNAVEMQLCETEVFYDNILNMYSPILITASDQFSSSNSIWAPVDGVHVPLGEVAWRSLSSSNSWWRIQLPYRIRISGVVIYRPQGHDMNAFAVYVGDSPVGNGSSNALCGKPRQKTVTRLIAIGCTNLPIGKYLYISADDRPGAAISFSEISVYTCQEPSAVITKKQVPHSQSVVFLTCQGTTSGCAVANAAWEGENGSKINAVWHHNYYLGGYPISSILVDRSIEQSLTCRVNYPGGSTTSVYSDTGRATSSPKAPPTTITTHTHTEKPTLDCSHVLFRCTMDPACMEVAIGFTSQSECREVLKTPPGSPPDCTGNCRELYLTFINTGSGRHMLDCNCASLPPNMPFNITELCSPFQVIAPVKCNVTQVVTEAPTTGAPTPTTGAPTPTTAEPKITDTRTTETITTEAPTIEAKSKETPISERRKPTTGAPATETPAAPKITEAPTQTVSAEAPTAAETPETPATEYVTKKVVTIEYSRTVAASSEASSSTPKLITDGSQEATSCLDVVFECQPFCLTTLQDLLAQCGEVLATPLGSAPPCTEGCRGILQTSLNTGFGVKLLNCDCASVQDVPQIGPLCRPFQQNALKKCNLSIDG